MRINDSVSNRWRKFLIWDDHFSQVNMSSDAEQLASTENPSFEHLKNDISENKRKENQLI